MPRIALVRDDLDLASMAAEAWPAAPGAEDDLKSFFALLVLPYLLTLSHTDTFLDTFTIAVDAVDAAAEDCTGADALDRPPLPEAPPTSLLVGSGDGLGRFCANDGVNLRGRF